MLATEHNFLVHVFKYLAPNRFYSFQDCCRDCEKLCPKAKDTCKISCLSRFLTVRTFMQKLYLWEASGGTNSRYPGHDVVHIQTNTTWNPNKRDCSCMVLIVALII